MMVKIWSLKTTYAKSQYLLGVSIGSKFRKIQLRDNSPYFYPGHIAPL